MRIFFPNQRGKSLIFQRLRGNELCRVVVAVGWHREGVALPGLHHSTVDRVSFSPGSPCAPQYLGTASTVLVLQPCLGFWDEPRPNCSLNPLLLSSRGSHKEPCPCQPLKAQPCASPSSPSAFLRRKSRISPRFPSRISRSAGARPLLRAGLLSGPSG